MNDELSTVNIQIRCLRHKNDWGALILVDERFVFRAKTPEGKKVVDIYCIMLRCGL